MDLLYSKYSNPLEFMNMYINQGRFGEFVTEIVGLENNRKQEEVEKQNEDRLWEAYLHSMSDKSFLEWKKAVMKKPVDTDAINAAFDAEETINRSKSILKGFSMKA